MVTEKNVPVSINPSSEELNEGKLTAQNLEIAIRALHQDGLIIICNVYRHEDLDKLNQVMVRDALKMSELGDEGPKNFHPGNLSITPPPQRQYFMRNVFLNPIVSQVTSAHLGPKPKWTFNSANAALPSGGDKKIAPLSQPTHTDAYFDHPRHPFADVISVPLVSMDAQNGATEVWLRTHTIMSGPELMLGASRESHEAGVAKKYLNERREKGFGPLQPAVPKGATVIRDIRLWHGGKPNLSDQPRIMLGQSEPYTLHLALVILKLTIPHLVHFASWYRNPMKLELADTLKDIVREEKDLDLPVKWISEEVAASNYLQRGFGGDFDLTQTP
jgi:hypothetical protein